MTPTKQQTQSWLPSIFNDFFGNEWITKNRSTVPAVNIMEDEKRYTVEVAVPGMTKEDFNIHLGDENELVISMEKKVENEDKENKKYLRREFSYTKFQQSLYLPDNVDKEKITANVANGVLTIELPKYSQEEKAKINRVIEIH
mgnify:CR=1 FL=1